MSALSTYDPTSYTSVRMYQPIVGQLLTRLFINTTSPNSILRIRKAVTAARDDSEPWNQITLAVEGNRRRPVHVLVTTFTTSEGHVYCAAIHKILTDDDCHFQELTICLLTFGHSDMHLYLELDNMLLVQYTARRNHRGASGHGRKHASRLAHRFLLDDSRKRRRQRSDLQSSEHYVSRRAGYY